MDERLKSMEKMIMSIFIAMTLFMSPANADELVLSTNIKVEYPSPVLIGHIGGSLVVKFKDWSFSHENLDPKTFYHRIDLTGIENEFIKSIFNRKHKSNLPEWLINISAKISEGMGNDPHSVQSLKLGKAEIYAGYNSKMEQGQVFILDDLTIHKIAMSGSKEKFTLMVKNIMER